MDDNTNGSGGDTPSGSGTPPNPKLDLSQPPPVHPINWDLIPYGLKASARWVLWSWVSDGRKWQKPPQTLNERGEVVGASTTNPAHWMSAGAARAAVDAGKAHGAGYVLYAVDGTDSMWTVIGIDIDDCLDENGRWLPGTEEQQAIVSRYPTYTEVSPSGRGVKLLYLSLQKLPGKGLRDAELGVEIYCHGRYFTITSRVIGLGTEFQADFSQMRVVDGEIVELYRSLQARKGMGVGGAPPQQVVRLGAPEGWQAQVTGLDEPVAPIPDGWEELPLPDYRLMGLRTDQCAYIQEGGGKATADDRSAMDYSIALSLYNRIGEEPASVLRCMMYWCPEKALENRRQDWASATSWMWQYTVWPALLGHRRHQAQTQAALMQAAGVSEGARDGEETEGNVVALPPGNIRDALRTEISQMSPGNEDALRQLLVKLAAAGLDPLDEDSLLNQLKQQSGTGLSALRSMLKKLRSAARKARREAREGTRAAGEGGGQARGPEALTMPLTPPAAGVPGGGGSGGGGGDVAVLPRKLVRNAEGQIERTVANLTWILVHHQEWIEVISYDTFLQAIRKRLPALGGVVQPGLWSDLDTGIVRAWVETHFEVSFSAEMVRSAVEMAAGFNPTHSVREWLQSLQWDGQPRLHLLLPWYFHAEEGDPCAAELGKLFMISAVARVMQPGCKVDTVLCVNGDQGLGKSTAFKILFGDAWFRDSELDLAHSLKDAYQTLSSTWCIELAEMASLSKAQTARVKAFFSSSIDHYRKPYGHYTETVPRQCVLVATGNDNSYLKDLTGNRRFWPITATAPIELKTLAEHREQLWAEALYLYGQGHKWWVDTGDSIAAALVAGQRARLIEPAATDLVRHGLEMLQHPTRVTIKDLLIPCGYSMREMGDRRVVMALAEALKFLNFEKEHTRVGNVWILKD